ncbi:MAG TPA: PadR family transcriptional regulator, partial [Solirubrobacteraceae bacterium]
MTCYNYAQEKPGFGRRHKGMHAALMLHGGDPRAHRGGPWGEPFGLGGPRGGFRGRHGKARRGDIRTAILLLLAEEPRNGYAIMQELEQRSDGIWHPSPGSVYPALSQLEDEGLVRSVENDGR